MDQKIGVNIGSGQRRFNTTAEVYWFNVDSQERWNPEIVCNGADLRGVFESESVDYVVLHHVLEHFGCGEGVGLIREAYRVLKPGGSLFVFVPDMRALAHGWLNGRITTQIYMTNIYGAYMGSEDDRHKWGFDYISLGDFLTSICIWDNIRNGEVNTPPGADVAHDWWILETECVK